MLDAQHAARLERAYHSVTGGWCCAPRDDAKRGMPNNHGFRLPLLPSEGVRSLLAHGSASKERGTEVDVAHDEHVGDSLKR